MILELKPDEPTFSAWQPCTHSFDIPQLDRPGIYAIAISTDDLSGSLFSMRKEICYFGMTISKGGLASRLYQFHGALFGTDGPHGGAWRVKSDYPNARHSREKFFVSVATFECKPTRKSPGDLRQMGKVLATEYICFAEYMEAFGHLPRYNDPNLRPKKYFGIGPNRSFETP